ncbi:MAG: TonB-dependent receptor, partial [Polyangiales bacterium]
SLPSLGRPPALSTVYIVRGAGPEESATYFDGAPLPHAFHFGGLVAVVPSAFVVGISVVPGGFGVAYGRATAGLIDVALGFPCPMPRTKASDPCRGVHGSITLDAIDVGAVGSAILTRSTRIAIGARRSHIDAWIGKILGDTVAGDLPRYLDGQFLIEHDFSARVRARFGLIAADDNVSVTDPNQPADKPRSGSWHSGLVRAHARLDADVGETGALLGVVALTRSSDSIIGETDQWGDVRKSLFVRFEGSSALGNPDGATWPTARVTLGLDAMATRIEGVRVLQVPVSGFGGSGVFPLRGALTIERVEPGAYAQLAIKPAAFFTFTPGVRVDRHYLGAVIVQPRLAVRAEVTKGTTLKGVVGFYSRPNVFDSANARDYQGAYLPVVVDAGPARGVHIGAGLEQRLAEGVDFLSDVYARTTSNVLVPLQQPARPIFEDRPRLGPSGDVQTDHVRVGYDYPLYAETGRARALGVELLLRFSARSFVGFVGYALGRAEMRDSPFTAWRRAPFDQTHVLNAAMLVRLGSGWELGARFRLVLGILDSPYPATEIAPKADPNVDPNRALPELAPIHSLDLRLEKLWHIGPEGGSGTLSAYVEVRNVYDRRAREPLAYNYVYGYPVVGNGLPIIPNIGVRGAF